MVLYALGSNGSGQLGIGHTADVSSPTRHMFAQGSDSDTLGPPVKISAGGNHTLVLYSNNELYITGSAENHDLPGLLAARATHEGTRYLASGVSCCSATWEASMLCVGAKSLLSYGKGEKGELGRGSQPSVGGEPCTTIPIGDLLPEGTFVAGLASGLQHTVAVLSDGIVLGWGNGRNGQLGQPAQVVPKPRKIEGIDFKVVKAVCGRQFTYLVGEPCTGRHIILGSDKWGLKSQAPATILGWKDIGACWGSIFVLFQSGKIASWGRDDHGQLAPSQLPPIAYIASGSEHTVALTENGIALAWGWGEHGNCGSPIDEKGDVKQRWNELSLPTGTNGPVKGIGAGCATSWIWT